MQGKSVKANWEIESNSNDTNALVITLTKDTNTISPDETKSFNNVDSKSFDNLDQGFNLKLTVTNKKQESVSASLYVTVLTSNSSMGAKAIPSCNADKFMCYHTYNNKLYALGYHNSYNHGASNVLLWETTNGQNWQPTTVNNSVQAFLSDTNVVNTKSNVHDVPLEFAQSPSLLYNNKLYLIGGSKYDGEVKSNEVYFYDFLAMDIGWQKDDDAAFSPRMGQACVTYNNEIWAIGGYADDGMSNEVWIYNINSQWTLQQLSKGGLPQPIGMATAVLFDGKPTLIGGFGEMIGYPDKNIFDTLKYTPSKGWQKLFTNNSLSFNTNTAAGVWTGKDPGVVKLFFFCHTKIGNDNSTNDYALYKLNDDGNGITNYSLSDYYKIEDYWYHIQCTCFKETLWLCGLSNNASTKPEELTAHYFVYMA